MLTRTRIGLIIQAALTHPQHGRRSATTCRSCSCWCSAAAAALAALAGVIGGPASSRSRAWRRCSGPSCSWSWWSAASARSAGAFVASLLIGLIQTFAVAVDMSLADSLGTARPHARRRSSADDLSNVTVAQVAPMMPYLLLVLMLIFRPTGLFGHRET